MGPLQVLKGVGIATTSALLQTFGILSWPKKGERKPRSQNFKPGPVWIKSSGQVESGSGALPGFKWRRTTANSLGEKFPKVFTASEAVEFQSSDNSCTMDQEISRFTPSYFPFFTSWLAIAFAETGHWTRALS